MLTLTSRPTATQARPTEPAESPDTPDWVARGSLALVLALTTFGYIWGLDQSGWANSFYSAAAQAGSQDWTAWFFGSLDSSNSITVDKSPAALWLMSLSVRVFGLSSWSILVPEALLGVASVGVLYATLRRAVTSWTPGATTQLKPRTAHWAALAGAVVFAVTPAAVLMFRFNNPDALMVFCLTLAGWFTVRATEAASRRDLVWAGVAVGFGFLAKMLQAFLVLPALVAAYAIAAPAAWRKKIVDLLAAFAAMIGSIAWYVAAVELTPASLRPYIGGSQNNSILELIFGYNGFGRLTGTEVGSVGPRGTSDTGLTRLFDGVSAGMVTWLIPAAMILAGIALVLLFRRRTRTGPLVAGLVVSLGWLIVTALVFSYMAGIYHDYYTVALAPAIGGCVALGAVVLWQLRERLVARLGLSVATAATSVLAVALLQRAGGWYAALGYGAAAVGLVAAIGLLFVTRLPRRLAATALALALGSGLAGPIAYSVDTIATPHTGSIVTAGPVSGGPGGGPDGGRRAPGQNGPRTPGQNAPGAPGQNAPGGNRGDGGPGTGRGGLLNGSQVSEEMKALLTADADAYSWVAATVGAQNAASYQLATGQPVMAIGGFNGSDPSPTLAQFQQLVAEGKIHYFLGAELGGRQNGGSDAAQQIVAWVQQNYTATTVGSVTVYDLTS